MTAMMNMQPVMEVDLLVLPEGRPPYPVTLRQIVETNINLGRLVPGGPVDASGFLGVAP